MPRVEQSWAVHVADHLNRGEKRVRQVAVSATVSFGVRITVRVTFTHYVSVRVLKGAG